jgi:hypothetical protein
LPLPASHPPAIEGSQHSSSYSSASSFGESVSGLVHCQTGQELLAEMGIFDPPPPLAITPEDRAFDPNPSLKFEGGFKPGRPWPEHSRDSISYRDTHYG